MGVWESLFKALADDPDFECVIVNPTIVRAHQHAAGAKGGLRLRRSGLARGLEHQAPYLRGRAGQSVARAPHPGPQARDDRGRALIEGLPAEIVIADSAFDAGAFRDHLAGRTIAAVIAANPTHASCPALDRHLYKERHLVECFINKITHFRRIATRYDKTALTYFSMVCIACMMLWLK